MSTKKIKDLAVVVGKYQKGGETKNRYLNVGCILQGDDGGKFMLLERTFNPAGVPNPEGKNTVLISMFDIKDDKAATTTPNSVEDEIPFN